jgi:hypothetical protein
MTEVPSAVPPTPDPLAPDAQAIEAAIRNAIDEAFSEGYRAGMNDGQDLSLKVPQVQIDETKAQIVAEVLADRGLTALRARVQEAEAALADIGLDYDHSRAERQRLESALVASREREKVILAVAYWQTQPGHLHPLMCGKDSSHEPLYPASVGDRIVLKCHGAWPFECDYQQERIPEVVLGMLSPSAPPTEAL